MCLHVKAIWKNHEKTIKELLKKRSWSSNIDCLKESGAEISSKKEIYNKMNNFFCLVGIDLLKQFVQPLIHFFQGNAM